MKIAGIDPGLDGGVGILDNGKLKASFKIPKKGKDIDWRKLRWMIQEHYPDLVIVEDQWERPKSQSKSTKTLLVNFGKLQLLVEDWLELNVEYVAPTKWKGDLGLSKDKQESIDMCKELFPKVDLQPGKCTKDQDGIAEGILLAYWRIRNE